MAEKRGGTEDFRVDAGDAVDMSGADDGEVGHTHLMAEVTTTHALAATAAAPSPAFRTLLR